MILRNREERALMLVYRHSILAQMLSRPKGGVTLASLGYPTMGTLLDMLCHLRTRIAGQEEFPDEIGFFLAIPQGTSGAYHARRAR